MRNERGREFWLGVEEVAKIAGDSGGRIEGRVAHGRQGLGRSMLSRTWEGGRIGHVMEVSWECPGDLRDLSACVGLYGGMVGVWSV